LFYVVDYSLHVDRKKANHSWVVSVILLKKIGWQGGFVVFFGYVKGAVLDLNGGV
jgi:hypothetical protein